MVSSIYCACLILESICAHAKRFYLIIEQPEVPAPRYESEIDMHRRNSRLTSLVYVYKLMCARLKASLSLYVTLNCYVDCSTCVTDTWDVHWPWPSYIEMKFSSFYRFYYSSRLLLRHLCV